MLKLKTHDILKIVTGKKWSTVGTANQWLNEQHEKLIKKWEKDQDFSIYDTEEYCIAAYLSWPLTTASSTKGTIQWCQENNQTNIKVFDDYNGVGLSSLLFKEAGMEVYYTAGNKYQQDIYMRLCEFYSVEPAINVDSTWIEDVDMFVSFQVIEHFKKPSEYIEKISKFNPKILAYSSGFSKRMYIGHFSEYLDRNNNIVNIYKIARECNLLIKNLGFNRKFVGFNNNPIIYKR